MNKLLKNSSIYALGDIAPKILTLISLPILTRYLVPAEYAIVNYVNTLNIFLLIISLLCINTYYLVYYYRVDNEVEQKKMLGNLSAFIITLNVIFTSIFILVGNIVMTSIDSNISFYPYILIGILINFFNILTILPSALFRVQERPLPLTVLNIIKGVLMFAFTLGFVIIFDFKALGILYSNLIVSFIFGLIFLFITFKNAIWNINLLQIKQALIFSLPLLPGSLAYNLISMSDRILIDKYLSLTSLGIYTTAASFALILNVITYGAYKAFEPHLFKIYRTASFINEFDKIRKQFFFYILMAACAIAMFSRELFILIINPDYIESTVYIPIILVGLIFSSLSSLYATIITARNKTKINSAITIVCGITSVSLNVLLLPQIGVLAACISSVCTFAIALTASIYYSKINIPNKEIYISFLLTITIAYVSIYIINFDSIIASIIYKFSIFVVLVTVNSKLLGVNIISFIRKIFNK